MYTRLSYEMRAGDPGWPGHYKMKIEPYSQIDDGKNANIYLMTMLNHFGSHMDGPRHFNNDGPRLAEMPLDTFIYHKPLLLDIPKGRSEQVTAADLQPHADRIGQADLLMIRSGFAVERERNPKLYSEEGPSVSSEAALYLMDHFANLKAIAMDWVSLATPVYGADGVLAHQYLLGKHHDHYICIIEDLNFTGVDAAKLKSVWSIPLFIEQVDSSPVTVIAEI